MNLKALTSALLIAGLAAPSAFASTGTINFTGSITNVTCKVSGGTPGTGNADFTVDVGPVNAADFVQVGSIAGNTGFRIYIGDVGDTTCTNGTKVWATFDPGSTVDPVTGALRTTGGATGVQLRLFSSAGEAIDIWSDDQNVVKETVVDNQAVLAYSAAYESTAPVTAGGANSAVLYTVRYEPTTP